MLFTSRPLALRGTLFALALSGLVMISSVGARAGGNTGGLTVFVVDGDGRPLQGIDVWVVDRSTPEQRFETDRHGYAAFLSLPVGIETIRVQGRRHNGCGALVRISADQMRLIRIVALPGNVLCRPLRLVNSSLVQSGVGADVYDVF